MYIFPHSKGTMPSTNLFYQHFIQTWQQSLCGDCFLTHRSFVYSLLTKGRPSPLHIVVSALIFCSVNGCLQGHYMLHCTQYHSEWHRDTRFITGTVHAANRPVDLSDELHDSFDAAVKTLLPGLLMFFTGMAINIHSDYILRNLRKPGEVNYKIPRGQCLIMMSSVMLLYGQMDLWKIMWGKS